MDTVGSHIHWHNSGTVAQWLALRTISEVFAREQGYKGGWEEALVVIGGIGGNNQVNLVVDFAGGADKVVQ